MSEQKKINPQDIVDLNVDYFAILGLNRETFPEGKTRTEREQIAEILDKAYKQSARICHPDFGGSPDDFKKVVRAHTILGDVILRSYYLTGTKPIFAGEGNVEVDWNNFGSYEEGTIQDTIGNSLFLNVCKRKVELQLIPAFRPSTDFDHYTWDWVIQECNFEPDKIFKLALALVHDENDVLRLTSGEDIEKSLPFKIYICIPRASLYFLKGEDEKFYYEDGSCDVLKGKLQGAIYSDINLLETTSLEDAEAYLANQLAKDLEDFRSGKLMETQNKLDIEAGQLQFVDKNKMNEIDTKILREILKLKSFKSKYDEKADEFVNGIKNKEHKNSREEVELDIVQED
jgi:hypothetical protein